MSAVSDTTYRQEFIRTKVRPLKRMRRSQLDRKAFRGMSDRAILLGSVSELYSRHAIGFWMTSSALAWAILVLVTVY